MSTKADRARTVKWVILIPLRSAHFHPAFKLIFSLPISLYRHDY